MADDRPTDRSGGLDRRKVLGLGATGIALAGLGSVLPTPVLADASVFRDRFQAFRQTFRVEPDPEEAWRMVDNVLRARIPRDDLITLISPDIAENGAVVPVTIRVDCAMTEADHPRRVHIIIIDNPFPEVAKFRFTPEQGEAEVSLRIRMRQTSQVVALAEMSDGSVGMTSRLVNVTLGACS